MSLVQDLLNKYKQGRETSILLNPERPAVPEDLPDTPVENQPAEQVPIPTPAASSAAPTNKWGYSDSEMSALAKRGFTPEKLDYYAGEYDPSKHGGYLQRMYESSVSAPVVPDEKQINRARLMSGIGDALGLIGQMVSVGRGAYARERDYSNSALGRTEAKERDLRNIYRQERSAYNNGLYNARQKDFLQGMEEYNAGRKGIQGTLDTNRKLEETARLADAKMRLEYDKLRLNQANKDKDFELKKQGQEDLKKYRNDMSARGWANIHLKSGGKDMYQMVIAANPEDMEAQEDDFGDKVRTYQVSSGDIDRLLGEALNDDVFKKTYPQYDRKPDLDGKPPKSFTTKERIDIANAYAKMKYDMEWQGVRMPWLRDMTDRHEDWGHWEN